MRGTASKNIPGVIPEIKIVAISMSKHATDSQYTVPSSSTIALYVSIMRGSLRRLAVALENSKFRLDML